MSAGLPGLGLGGLFFILSALVAPFVELLRTVRGQSSRARWAEVGRQFALAALMIVAVDLTIRAAYAMLAAAGLHDEHSAGPVTALPLLPIGITAALLAFVLLTAKGMQLASRLPVGPLTMPRVWPSRPRLLAGTATLFAAWFALLFLGASQLSTLSGELGEGGRDAPAEEVVSDGGEGAPGSLRGDSVQGSASGEPAADLGPSPGQMEQSSAGTGVDVDLTSGQQGGAGPGEGIPATPPPAGGAPVSPGGQANGPPPGQAQAGGGPPEHRAGPPEDAGPPRPEPSSRRAPDRPRALGRPRAPAGRRSPAVSPRSGRAPGRPSHRRGSRSSRCRRSRRRRGAALPRCRRSRRGRSAAGSSSPSSPAG